MTFDPLVEERVSPTVTVERAENGDPLIIPRGGEVAVPYTRASGLADFLTYYPKSLADWYGRYEAQGIARRRDLAARVAAVHYSTGPLTGTLPIEARREAAAEIDECRRLAREYMCIDEASNLGTAGHSLTVPGMAGETSEELVDVVKGYHELTAGLERVGSEIFVVCDELKAAGTFDSAYRDIVHHPGQVVVGDTKTGKNYHQAEFEMQLAVYANGELYQRGGGRLTFEEAFGLPVNTTTAYLVHISITGAPKPRIVLLDLERGWRRAELAAAVRDERIAIDKTGIGEKFDHRSLAIHVLHEQLADMFKRFDTYDADPQSECGDKDWLQARGRELYGRFEPYWENSMTLDIKERLS